MAPLASATPPMELPRASSPPVVATIAATVAAAVAGSVTSDSLFVPYNAQALSLQRRPAALPSMRSSTPAGAHICVDTNRPSVAASAVLGGSVTALAVATSSRRRSSRWSKALGAATVLSLSAARRGPRCLSGAATASAATAAPPATAVPPQLRYPGMQKVGPEFVTELTTLFRNGGYWPWEEAQLLVSDAVSILAKEGTLEKVTVPAGEAITVVGDVHGQLFDLDTIFSKNGPPGPKNPFLFNGDFVDRGSYSVETLLVLLAWKVAYPEHVHLNRGNHESHEMNIPYGFTGEAITKYNVEAYGAFQRVFSYLPLAHVVNDEVLIVHGGLPRKDNVGLRDIEALDRVLAAERQQREFLFTDLLWADPRTPRGHKPSERGGDVMTFGPDVTEKFLRENDLKLLIRSHEVKDDGYEFQHGKQVLTVFSAPMYADACDNKGAVIRLQAGEDGKILEPEVRCFDACSRPSFYVPAMAFSPLNPQCMRFLSRDAVRVLRAGMQQ